MTAFDEIDLEILRLLVEDGRRPYSDIAEHVDRSPPAVADRIERLEDAEIIRGFTVEVDRSMLTGGVDVLVDVHARPGSVEGVGAGIEATRRAEHVFTTVDGHVVFQAAVSPEEISTFLSDAVDLAEVRDYDVRLLADAVWTPTLDETGFSIECAECGNTVTSEGESAGFDDRRYHFCCDSCLENFRERYERIRDGMG